MTGYTFEKAPIAGFDPKVSGMKTDPIGSHFGFSGTISGGGHVIRHLTISGTNNLGFIGVLSVNGQMHGIGIEDASILGTGNSIGALVGYAEGHVLNCYSTGHISGQKSTGGLVGELYHGMMTRCYSHAHTTGDTSVGGLVGSLSMALLTHCYSTGTVDARIALDGLSGFPSLTSKIGCFWDVETSGIPAGTYMAGLNTDQMQDIGTFLDAGWNFLGETENASNDTWMMPEGGGYPELSVFSSGQPALTGPCLAISGDANDVLWNASDYFNARWDSVALTTIAHNSVIDSGVGLNSPERILTISGRIEVIDTNDLLGLDTENSFVCQAFDQDGNEMALPNRVSPFEPVYQWKLLNWRPREITLQLQLTPDQIVPTALARVDFYAHALFARPFVTVDMPFEVTADWVELAPGFRVLIEKAVSKDGICEYQIQQELTGPPNSYLGLSPYDELTSFILLSSPKIADLYTRDYLFSLTLMDSEEKPTSSDREYTGSKTSYDPEGKTIMTNTGYISDCSGIATLRYSIAVQPYKVIVPMTITDITLDGF
ncbi:MAG: hypothetical protein K9N55_08615 [Phycisphaerae bacterium]|nr:hypothetical protein [Phycisphaerae bacterium]